MTLDRFEEILKELSLAINVPALHPDKHRVCRLNINGMLHIQLECQEHKDRLLIATFVCDVLPGKFREKLLKETLKMNGAFPRIATFAYSERNAKLVLFTFVPLFNLTGEKLAEKLNQFIDMADSWRVAVDIGAPLPGIAPPSPPSTKPPGIKP